MMRRIITILFVLCATQIGSEVFGQSVSVKSNLLYLGTTTPNIGFEFRTSSKTTLSLSGGYNPFNFPTYTRGEDVSIHPKLRHWVVMPEFKYWFCKSFERSNIGIHGIYGEFNIGGLPFSDALRDYRYRGNAYGGGLSVGYHWAIGRRWGLEASLGAGYLHLHYKKYECGDCGDELGEYHRDYIGPTKVALSLIYFFK